MHFVLPIAEAVHHHLADVRLAEIQRVTSPRVVSVRAGWIEGLHVVARRIETFEAVSGTNVISLTRMVVHNVQHHEDSGFVKSFDHILELNMLVVIDSRCILRMRCEEVQRHVSPIVTLLRIALKYGHQFDDCDPKILQIRNLFDQSGVCPSSRMNAPRNLDFW